MSTNYQWLTPEEKQKRKQRKKTMIYASFILFSILLSAVVTVVANQL